MSESTKKVLQRFMRLQMLLHRYQIQSFMSFGPWGNPNRGQGRVLSILKMKPEISQKELSYLLDMSKQALAELLVKLEKSGYIQREASEEDRRSVIVMLTEAGKAVAGEMDETAPDLEKLFDCLSEEELTSLGAYLQRLIDRFDAQLPGDDGEWRRQMKERFKQFGRNFGEELGFDSDQFPGFFGGGFRGGWGCRQGHGGDDK